MPENLLISRLGNQICERIKKSAILTARISFGTVPEYRGFFLISQA